MKGFKNSYPPEKSNVGNDRCQERTYGLVSRILFVHSSPVLSLPSIIFASCVEILCDLVGSASCSGNTAISASPPTSTQHASLFKARLSRDVDVPFPITYTEVVGLRCSAVPDSVAQRRRWLNKIDDVTGSLEPRMRMLGLLEVL